MLRYTKEQVLVLFAVATLFAATALWQIRPQAAAGDVSTKQLPYVYELAGEVLAPGLYRFDSPQTLGSLLSAAHAPAVSAAQPGIVVPNGSRITVGSTVQVGEMRAQDRLNCFLPIVLQSASAEDLELIPGMGKKTAEAIIAYRDQAGGISSISELTGVRGIGVKKLARFRPYLAAEH